MEQGPDMTDAQTQKSAPWGASFIGIVREIHTGIRVRMSGSRFLTRFGGDLLSHVLRRSTIGATVLNDRVRDGIGCFTRAMTTKPRKKPFQVNTLCCVCFGPACLVAPLWGDEAWLLLDQIKPIGQLVPVN